MIVAVTARHRATTTMPLQSRAQAVGFGLVVRSLREGVYVISVLCIADRCRTQVTEAGTAR